MNTMAIYCYKRPSGWTFKVYRGSAMVASGAGFKTRAEAFGTALQARCIHSKLRRTAR